MISPRMVFEVKRNKDGTVHVQNIVLHMGIIYKGQHHVHTEEGFRKWLEENKIDKDSLIYLEGECDCGLKAGYVKEYDGKVWFDERYL